MSESQKLSSKQFYGTSETFVPPALNPGRGLEAALNAARKDPSRTFRVFFTQSKAFSFCDAHVGLQLRTWAYEIDDKGHRRFVVASCRSFWRWYRRYIRRASLLHFYEVIRESHASKLYLDLEYNRKANPDSEPEDMIDAIISSVAALTSRSATHTSLNRRDPQVITELDSTTPSKFSRHVIFQTVAFHDNIQAGAFAQSVVEAVCEKDSSLMMVKKADGATVPFLDLAVYTKNRCFRLVGSSKFGRDTRLLHMGQPRSPGARLCIGERLFFDSLVCNISRDVMLLGTVPVLQHQLLAHSGYLPRHAPQNSCLPLPSSSAFAENTYGKSPYPTLDAYVLGLAQPLGGGIYGVTYFAASDTVTYAMKGGYRYCARIGRCHKSNNVILIAELAERRMYQKCFDPDCRGFRSKPWDLPATVFAERPPEAGADADLETLSDAVLNQLMDSLEASGTVDVAVDGDCGVADDARIGIHGEEAKNISGEVSDRIMNEVLDLYESGLIRMQEA